MVLSVRPRPRSRSRSRTRLAENEAGRTSLRALAEGLSARVDLSKQGSADHAAAPKICSAMKPERGESRS